MTFMCVCPSNPITSNTNVDYYITKSKVNSNMELL